MTAADRALFLIQATFGPTLASLQAMGQSSFKQWIDEQMKMPIESHREYYRRRANPYLLPPRGHFLMVFGCFIEVGGSGGGRSSAPGAGPVRAGL